MTRLNLFTRRRSRRRGFSPFISLLLAASTGYYFWNGREKLELPFQLPGMGGASVAPAGEWEVYFSPHGGATDAIIRELGRAKRTVRVQAYSFTSAPIAKALVSAKERGIDVQVILDKSQRSERYTSATYLANRGVPVLIDDAHAIAHDKVILLDGQTVITGSFNFTKSAEKRNSENLLILRNAPDLAAKYEKHWSRHAGHSRPYRQIGERAAERAPQRWRPPGLR